MQIFIKPKAKTSERNAFKNESDNTILAEEKNNTIINNSNIYNKNNKTDNSNNKNKNFNDNNWNNKVISKNNKSNENITFYQKFANIFKNLIHLSHLKSIIESNLNGSEHIKEEFNISIEKNQGEDQKTGTNLTVLKVTKNNNIDVNNNINNTKKNQKNKIKNKPKKLRHKKREGRLKYVNLFHIKNPKNIDLFNLFGLFYYHSRNFEATDKKDVMSDNETAHNKETEIKGGTYYDTTTHTTSSIGATTITNNRKTTKTVDNIPPTMPRIEAYTLTSKYLTTSKLNNDNYVTPPNSDTNHTTTLINQENIGTFITNNAFTNDCSTNTTTTYNITKINNTATISNTATNILPFNNKFDNNTPYHIDFLQVDSVTLKILKRIKNLNAKTNKNREKYKNNSNKTIGKKSLRKKCEEKKLENFFDSKNGSEIITKNNFSSDWVPNLDFKNKFNNLFTFMSPSKAPLNDIDFSMKSKKSIRLDENVPNLYDGNESIYRSSQKKLEGSKKKRLENERAVYIGSEKGSYDYVKFRIVINVRIKINKTKNHKKRALSNNEDEDKVSEFLENIINNKIFTKNSDGDEEMPPTSGDNTTSNSTIDHPNLGSPTFLKQCHHEQG